MVHYSEQIGSSEAATELLSDPKRVNDRIISQRIGLKNKPIINPKLLRNRGHIISPSNQISKQISIVGICEVSLPCSFDSISCVVLVIEDVKQEQELGRR